MANRRREGKVILVQLTLFEQNKTIVNLLFYYFMTVRFLASSRTEEKIYGCTRSRRFLLSLSPLFFVRIRLEAEWERLLQRANTKRKKVSKYWHLCLRINQRVATETATTTTTNVESDVQKHKTIGKRHRHTTDFSFEKSHRSGAQKILWKQKHNNCICSYYIRLICYLLLFKITT